ncbi:hypothetical protein BD779DRAFT_1661654 [Infundibulicybe gibba]|nr:hypothetical protein BD779DRAFT_1661654 [Infundibulicybe gibba]
MAPSPSAAAATTSVQVALRIRPPTTQDSTSIPTRFQRSVIHATSPTSISIESTSGAPSGTSPSPSSASSVKKQFFSFDQVHPPPTTQYDLFTSTAQPLVSRFVEGFNCTILAYGQTSSGKTFTMTGIDLDADPSDPNNGMGIIPRAVSNIFSRAKQLKDERGGSWNYSIKGSFIEIYNEDLIDLLSLDDSTGGRREVQIREDKDGHIIWGGLREVNVRNSGEVMTLIRKGTSIRRTNETDMNAQSSRSHAIFSLTLTQKKFTGSVAPTRSPSPLPLVAAHPHDLLVPVLCRPGTPSFASAIGRGGGLRPSSALGHAGERSHGSSGDEDVGEWVTIVSKFHFVDLAGSERLKRTAAAGERIKEGISINSGLLALGNVISALGDPSRAKSNTATHIPYRDSKLTRLLQDSLGGNAHTLMIACVSPAEWNAGETINTLKYANRARNIKNRAVLNEREDGWDDVEWLQGTVSRLRKELKVIKDGGIASNSSDRVPEVVEGAGKKVLARMTELQNNYEDLREKFVERTEELTRLRRELGEKHRGSSSGAVGGTAKYEEIVGPVIEEYEKTIAAMEAELNLNRAALRHTNEMVEEKEEELAAVTERHAATELYVEELRTRVAKMSEREASTEAYIRDIEEKMKTYDETSVMSSESMTDLKREVARFKDTESHSAKYIADLEARLSRSDESVLALQQTVEKLEEECDRRREEAQLLQSRLESLRRDGESWRTDLEEREKRVKDLEDKMVEWERKKRDAGAARARLGTVEGEVASARRSLEVDLARLLHGSIPGKPTVALQQTHTATLADLSSVSSKYRDALREISDLAAQIQEAKLNNPTILESSFAESPAADRPADIPPSRRRMTASRARESTEPQLGSPGRRLFFRQAASAESLHLRSLSQSQSLSQELSSAHSRKTSFSSYGTGSSHSPSNSHSNPHAPRLNLSASFPPTSSIMNPNERSVASLEKEIMRLQEVLKERETEITTLEHSLRSTQEDSTPAPFVPKTNGHIDPPQTLSPKTLNQFDHIRKTMENGNGHMYPDHHETNSERNGSSVFSETDESLDRLNELMLSMAQKESQHREIVDGLDSQLTQVRRQLDDLTALSRDQALNMSTEIEALSGKHRDDLATLEKVQKREEDLLQSLKIAESEHATAIEDLRLQHEAALHAKGTEIDEMLARIKVEHDASLSSLRSEIAAASEALEKSRQEHEVAFGKLKADHQEELALRLQEVNEVLNRTREEHDSTLARVRGEYAQILKDREAETTATLQATEEEYYNALTKLRGDHAEALKRHTDDATASMERLREEHAGEMRMLEIAREGSLSESQSSRTLALQVLQEEHAAALVRKESSYSLEVENLRDAHTRSLQNRADEHQTELDRLRSEHENNLVKVKQQWADEIDQLKTLLTTSEERNAAAAAKALEADTSIQSIQEQQASVLQEIERGHEEDVTRIKALNESALTELANASDSQRIALIEAHKNAIELLQSQHKQESDDLAALLTAAEERHQQTLDDTRTKSERRLKEEEDRFATAMSDIQRRHSEELDSLRKDYELLVQELEAHKVAADEYALVREQTRETHEHAIEEKTAIIRAAEQHLFTVNDEKQALVTEVAKLREELNTTRSEQSKLIQEASKRESLVGELDRHRALIAEMEENLQKVKDEKDILQTEKNRSDSLVRDLQAQIARSSSPPNSRSVPDRNMSYTRATGLPAMKLPPPTPPPSVPPPPAPRSTNHEPGLSTSSQASSAITLSSSKESQPDSPSTSIGHPSINGQGGSPIVDAKLTARVEQQAKQIDEQEAMIKTLNKQLTHCESDLQTHMDLVTTLETSLGDSEKNLRKARMQATEISRERDTLSGKIEALRAELTEAKREVVTVRRSIVEEKQSLEQRLDEERRGKERARQQLESRMEELQKRKSKFACL